MFSFKLYLQAVQPQISSGLRISSRRGSICRAMRRCSREWDGSREMIWDGTGPRWVIRNIYSE